MTGAVIPKIESGTDRRKVLCTTYQMRNCFRQFADGAASELDVHCYFQHAYAADLCPKGGAVLDVCCGRGLLIPFLRYRAKCSLYVGVDIHPQNARWKDGADPRREAQQKTDWGIERIFVSSNVAEMTEPVLAATKDRKFDLVVYTSSIEHMQPEAQQASLHACRELANEDATLYLTCPVTPKNRNGYAAQYAAHVYEPSKSELQQWLDDAGWTIKRAIGLSTGCKRFRAVLTGKALDGAEYLYKIMPREQALPMVAALYPDCATEMAYVCQ